MHVLPAHGLAELIEEEPLGLHRLKHLAVVLGRLVRKPAAVAPHDLVDRECARIGAVLLHDVEEELRAFLCRCPRAERLLDRIDVVVDRLGKPDNDERIVVFREVRREIGSRGVRVVAADRVKDVNAVLDQLVRRDLERILALGDKAALDAVLDIRELHPAVADRTAAMTRENERVLAHLGRDGDVLALQKPHVAIHVSDHLDAWGLFRVFVDQKAYRAGKARRKTARRQKRNLLNFLHFL